VAFCTQCGAALKAGAHFCSSCGAPVNGISTSPQVDPSQGPQQEKKKQGFFAKMKERSEQRNEERELKAQAVAKQQAAAQREEQHAAWQANVQQLETQIQILNGAPNSNCPINLHQGERGVVTIESAGLVEQRRGQGTYVGASQGVSIPIGKIGNRPIRYRVGASRGHYVQGALEPTVTDKGSLVITNQRIVYLGVNKTIECAFAKLIAINHSNGLFSISVSNRQKPTNVFVGPSVEPQVLNYLEVALAVFRGDEADLLKQFEAQLAELKSSEPSIEGSSPS
jgi:uncharacterized Zn finger protein (UPF0148 family)